MTTTDVRSSAIEALAGRPAAMLGLARRAGYADAEILPIEHPVWRFYRLVP